MFGLNMIVNKGKTVFIADTTVHEYQLQNRWLRSQYQHQEL